MHVSLWTSSDFLRLSTNARVLLLNLSTGSGSSFAGIGRCYLEAVMKETGLSASETESAFAELEKLPATARSFIVRDSARGIVWVRDFLKNDPARETDPEIKNVKHRIGIETTLGELPKDSPAVRKFRHYYKFTRHTPPDTPPKGPAGGIGYSSDVPEPENDKRQTTSGTDSKGLQSLNGRPSAKERVDSLAEEYQRADPKLGTTAAQLKALDEIQRQERERRAATTEGRS